MKKIRLINNKYIKNILCIVLIIAILTNTIGLNIANASAVAMGGIAIKVLATILASMGILSFVESSTGVDEFYNDFIDHLETVKNIHTGVTTLAKMGIDAMLNSAEMTIKGAARNMVNYISEFYTEVYVKNLDIGTGTAPVGTGAYMEGTKFYHTHNLEYFDWGTGVYAPLYGWEEIPGSPRWGWELGPGIEFYIYHVYHEATDRYYLSAFLDNIYEGTYYFLFNDFMDLPWNDYTGLQYLADVYSSWTESATFDISITDSLFRWRMNVNCRKPISYDDPIIWEEYVKTYDYSIPINPGWEITDLPSIGVVPSVPGDVDYPLPRSVPLGLSMPWELGLANQHEVIGKTDEQFLEGIDSLPIQNYVDKLIEEPVEQINSRTQIEIVMDNDGIITDVITHVVELTLPGVLPELQTQTGILGGLQGLLESIKNGVLAIPGWLSSILSKLGDISLPDIEFPDIAGIISNIFTVPDDISINMDPLKNLTITDRFPFSLPWDLKNSIALLSSTPQAPEFEFDIKGETLNIDFEEFSSLAQISRSIMVLIFTVVLIIITRRFIGGA